MNELLIAVLIVLLFFTLHGYNKGFIKIIISLVSLVLTIWLVSVVTPYISDYLIEETPVYNQIKEQITEAFAEDNSRLDNTIAENQEETIKSYGLPVIIKNALISNNTVAAYQDLMVSQFEDYISSYIARIIINAMAFVCTFLMITIFLRFTFFSMKLIAELPIIKGLNRFAGLFAGLLEGVLLIWIGFIGATIFAGKDLGVRFFELVDKSIFLSFLYDNNVLLQILYTFVF